jgi:trans-aconitate 2-methyltransferase
MVWNPDIYNQYKSERAAPFYDLLHLVKPNEGMKVIDLGCGTGELTKTLADKLPGAEITGIDSSAEMLTNAATLENDHLHFAVRNIEEQMTLPEKWDLIFSNAAIQWTDDHEQLFPKIIAALNTGGQLAIQMPAQHSNITNVLLNELADDPSFKESLQNFKRISLVLNIDRYAAILFENGAVEITAFEKIYPLILPDTEALFTWVSGTALIPYIDRLDGKLKDHFIQQYNIKLRKHFKASPLFYPFKRILLHGQF